MAEKTQKKVTNQSVKSVRHLKSSHSRADVFEGELRRKRIAQRVLLSQTNTISPAKRVRYDTVRV